MKKSLRPLVVLVGAPVLFSGLLCQTAHAQLAPGGSISGESILEDTYGVSSGPEALIVSWTVAESYSDLYTYTYNVSNPAGDELLTGPSPGTPDGTPEIFEKFTVSFPDVLGATVLSQSGASVEELIPGATGGATWSPNFGDGGIAAGTASGPLTLTSDLPPSAGYAQANDANAPSPWHLDANGEELPVPGTGDFVVPDSTSTMSLLGGLMTLLPLGSVLKKAVRK